MQRPRPKVLFNQTFAQFFRDGCTSMAASLSYYTLFSLPPLLYLLLTLLTWIFGLYYEDAPVRAARVIQEHAASIIGIETAEAEIHRMMENAQQVTGGLWKTLLGVLGVLIGATGVVSAMQETLNRIWEVRPDPKRSSILEFLIKRLLSLAMILAFGFLLLVSFVVSAFLSLLVRQLPFASWFGTVVNFVALLSVLTVFFAAMFRFMPDARIAWRDTWLGGAVTAILFVVGQFLLNLYIRFGLPESTFATAAASLLILLTWVYYSSLVVLLGAEFTRVWATCYGSNIRPEKGAVRVVEQVVREPPT
jgi:membrane protein